MRLHGTILLLLLFLCLTLAVAVDRVGNQAVDVWAEQSQRPQSATNVILQSRQTPPVSPDNGNRTAWFGAGLLALTLVIMGSVLFAMRGGAELLRQWRLVRRRPSRRASHNPYLPENTWPELPPAPPVRYLPEVDDAQVVADRD